MMRSKRLQRMIKLRLMDAITLLREDDGLNVTLEQ